MKYWNYIKKMDATTILVICFFGILFLFFLMNSYVYIGILSEITGKIVKNEDVNLNEEKERLSYLTQANIWRKDDFIDLNGWMYNMLGRREMNGVYKMSNGCLTFVKPYVDTSSFAESTIILYNELSKRGIDMLYTQAPFKNESSQNLLPPSIYSYSDRNADDFLKAITNANVPVLNFKTKIQEENMDFDSLFYRTDFHWNTQAGFWAFQKIAEKIKNDFDINIDSMITDITQYTIEIHKSLFRGAHAQRTGKHYAGLDDISFFIPAFPTQFSIQLSSLDAKEGKFEETLLNRELLSLHPYMVHLGSDYSLTIKNHLIGNGKKIMIIKDSFALPVIPFLALAFKQVEVIDLRYGKHESLINTIDSMKPDIVVFIYTSATLDVNPLFNFFEPQ